MANAKITNTPFPAVADQRGQNSLSRKTKASRYFKRNLHRWHRILGLITVIPVIFWTVSGLMHPFMSHWFKPALPREFMTARPLVREQIGLSPVAVLTQNGIGQFKNFRFVHLNQATYYQVRDTADYLQYFHAQTGQPLANGDAFYAETLARYVIADSLSPIRSVSRITHFTQEYKYVNRLLPVWKVSFNRPDGMDVYIETEQSRLATFNTHSRKTFLWIFDTFHNWSFLERISTNGIRITVMPIILSIIIFSAVSGLVIYGLFWKRFKHPTRNNHTDPVRKYHRQIGLAVSLVTFTFAFSGAWHATRKYTPDDRNKFVYEPVFKTTEIADVPLPEANWARLLNIQLVRMGRENYFQLFYDKTDLEPSEVTYQHVATNAVLKDGNIRYAQYIANKFANLTGTQGNFQSACCDVMSDVANAAISNDNLAEAKMMYRFDREYGFVNKRLPVVRLAYHTPAQTTYYIEPATSRLAAKIENADRAEGWSFAILHKYLLLEWAGKNIRDAVTLLAAAGVLTVFGLALFIKRP